MDEQRDIELEEQLEVEQAPPPPSSNTKLIIGIVVVFVLVAAGVGGYFLLKDQAALQEAEKRAAQLLQQTTEPREIGGVVGEELLKKPILIKIDMGEIRDNGARFLLETGETIDLRDFPLEVRGLSGEFLDRQIDKQSLELVHDNLFVPNLVYLKDINHVYVLDKKSDENVFRKDNEPYVLHQLSLDPNSFRVINGNYVADDKQVLYYGKVLKDNLFALVNHAPVTGIDAKTARIDFEENKDRTYVSNHFNLDDIVVDDQWVYYQTKRLALRNRDFHRVYWQIGEYLYPTIHIISDESVACLDRENNWKILQTDLPSFTWLYILKSTFYARDGNGSIYVDCKKFQEFENPVDPKNIVFKGPVNDYVDTPALILTNRGIYNNKGEIILEKDIQDIESFRFYDRGINPDSYLFDRNGFFLLDGNMYWSGLGGNAFGRYFRDSAILVNNGEIDLNSFEVLHFNEAKDKNHVYSKGEILFSPGDPKTITIVWCPFNEQETVAYFKDILHAYTDEGKIIDGVNPDSDFCPSIF